MDDENENIDRDGNGRFNPGNVGGPGRPKGSSPQIRFRSAMYAALTEADIVSALQCLRDVMADREAKTSDRIAAAKEILDRACGRPLPPDLEDLVLQAEALIAGGRR